MFDIIYSYTVHEAPDVIMDTLRNLYYYNRSLNIAVVIGPNQYMYDNLKDRLSEFKNCYLAPPFIKKTYSISLTMGHIRNFQFCYDNDINSEEFILMASTSYFHKEITKEFISSDPRTHKHLIKEDNRTWGWWDKIYANIKIRNTLKNNGISAIFGHHHEGLMLKYSTIKFISDIDKSVGFDSNVECDDIPFEEYIFPSVCMYLEGKVRCICYMCYEIYSPPPDYVKTITMPCYKRIQMDINAPVRVWQRSITNNYLH